MDKLALQYNGNTLRTKEYKNMFRERKIHFHHWIVEVEQQQRMKQMKQANQINQIIQVRQIEVLHK